MAGEASSSPRSLKLLLLVSSRSVRPPQSLLPLTMVGGKGATSSPTDDPSCSFVGGDLRFEDIVLERNVLLSEFCSGKFQCARYRLGMLADKGTESYLSRLALSYSLIHKCHLVSLHVVN